MKSDVKEIIKRYKEQDKFTADFMYVEVQEQICVGAIKEGYSVNCPYGDGEIKTKYFLEGDEELEADSKEELVNILKEEDIEFLEEDIKTIDYGYIWVPVQFCLTMDGASEYIKLNEHNHNGNLRIYINRFHDRNTEMNKIMEYLTKIK